jgi:hypothetical protein
MTPYSSYQLYQIERPKSTTEIRHANVQAGLLAATIANLLHAVARPVRAIRKPGLVTSPASASCAVTP